MRNLKDGLVSMCSVKIIFRVIEVALTVLVALNTANSIMSNSIERDSDYIAIPQYEEVYYEYLSYDSVSTQREALSNISYNMEKEGYDLINAEYTNHAYDYTFKNKDTENVWRVYFDEDSNYMVFFNSDYESSFKGHTYITERR